MTFFCSEVSFKSQFPEEWISDTNEIFPHIQTYVLDFGFLNNNNKNKTKQNKTKQNNNNKITWLLFLFLENKIQKICPCVARRSTTRRVRTTVSSVYWGITLRRNVQSVSRPENVIRGRNLYHSKQRWLHPNLYRTAILNLVSNSGLDLSKVIDYPKASHTIEWS